MTVTYHNCPDCLDYMDVRHSVVIPAIADRRAETGETSQQILDRYMRGVHDRHRSGLPILPKRAA